MNMAGNQFEISRKTIKCRRNQMMILVYHILDGIVRQLCEYKNVEIVEVHAMSDHIHMLVRIPHKILVSGFMG